MSIFSPGETMLQGAFAYASSRVDYYRDGSVLASAIPAKLGRTIFRYDTPAGVTIRTEQRDFIFRSSDLNIEPETGDEIVFDGDVYVVSAPNAEPCWRWHTRQTNAEIRVHAKNAGRFEEPSSSSSSSSGVPEA